ncbi:MAG: enoyl-CoA hydratase/isomerase family protein [Acidimicrobiales bacterium]|jgi:enoyl-CoA hydratase|nr:enoyl-CoA hydratase/isomerase family protein [Acidimicrobiales bacterium]MDP6650438.1 enoyl-CoA hydratase/isomerase family protein [Acidimicrobiales bacterium]MDP6759601.1 enoyl-CoA hydratase/isomerase family protein [Acidimicrobiales bacterium]|tara:strand:- start:2906 stop:3556 length:651 start_codon:yes stop_codon:yes gene_type:complete
MADAPLRVEDRGDGVVLLTLDRPDRRNALSSELRGLLADTLGRLAADDDCRAVVLTGAGSTFCAGFDLGEIAEAESLEELFAEAEAYHHAVHTFPKPLVAAVGGPAVAGGMDLALMCDLRLAHAGATFGQPQVRAGIPAAYDLVRTVVPEPVARDLCLTGRVVDAAEALRVGLANRVVDGDDLLEQALELAALIAASPDAEAAKRRFIDAQPGLFT